MYKPILNMMMGIPASGKSTFTKKMSNPMDIVVSRDKIRFNILKDGDKYFSKENEVFDTFVNEINNGLRQGRNVWADATHLTRGSRKKLLQKMRNPADINIIFMDTPLDLAIERNETRNGTKTYVPREDIQDMHRKMEMPMYRESVKIKNIFKVNIDINNEYHLIRIEEN